MRDKLQKFTDYANTLLPHETDFLLAHQQFLDESKLAILRQVDYNCKNIRQFTPYDVNVDKRKYSNLKNWIKERLDSIDVDAQFEWMSHIESQIMTDAITAEEEKQLLKAIRHHDATIFYFMKFYELVQNYRHFLLIRMRYADHKTADNFMKKYRAAYEQSRSINEKIHQATLDIVNQYAQKNTESIQWEEWLSEIFFNEKLDGLNRYYALVRLTFIYFNYRNFEKLKDKFDYLDSLLSRGVYYSKRILLNYYSNRLLLHSKFREFDRAEYYGYLSIRGKNSDYIHYINNLAAILLRLKKHKEALRIMREALPDMKVTQSYHNKIGFVAFYVKCLNSNLQFKSAENYSESFLRVYKKEVFEYRWHIFFSAYLESLLGQEKYAKLLNVVKKYQLPERDLQYQASPNYLPTIPWYIAIAEYKEQKRPQQDLTREFLQYLQGNEEEHSDKLPLLLELLNQVRTHIPKSFNDIQAKLHEKGLGLFLG